MTDRSHEPSGFLRVFAPLLGVLAGVGIVVARRGHRQDAPVQADGRPTTAATQDDGADGPEGHPS